MPENLYYIISAANIQIDSILKNINDTYVSLGGVFGPIFNNNGTKVLVQIKGNVTVPPNVNSNYLFFGNRGTIATNLNAAEWQLRIIPPESLTASYFAGTINIGQYLTQVRAITPVQGSAIKLG